MKRRVAPARCHGLRGEPAPRLAVEAEAAVEAIAQPLRIGEGYRPPAPETVVMPSWPPGSATLRRPPSLAGKPAMH